MEGNKGQLKRCKVNLAHIWMADIPFCPYCNLSVEARIYYDKKERENESTQTGRILSNIGR